MKKIFFAGLIALLLLNSIVVSFAKEGTAVGDKAPEFKLQDLNKQAFVLRDATASNSATLLVFWATWCPFCKNEIPGLIKLNDEYKDKGLKIVAIDVGESAKKVEGFAKQKGINYTVLLDPNNKVAGQYSVVGIPSNILIDKDGIIKYRGTTPPPENLLPKK